MTIDLNPPTNELRKNLEAKGVQPPPVAVVLETPYAGDTTLNVAYARACMLDSLRRGEAPFLSHLLYTQVLDDDVPDERELGITAGMALGDLCTMRIVYVDLGISRGMKLAMQRPGGLTLVYRSLRREGDNDVYKLMDIAFDIGKGWEPPATRHICAKCEAPLKRCRCEYSQPKHHPQGLHSSAWNCTCPDCRQAPAQAHGTWSRDPDGEPVWKCRCDESPFHSAEASWCRLCDTDRPEGEPPHRRRKRTTGGGHVSDWWRDADGDVSNRWYCGCYNTAEVPHAGTVVECAGCGVSRPEPAQFGIWQFKDGRQGVTDRWVCLCDRSDYHTLEDPYCHACKKNRPPQEGRTRRQPAAFDTECFLCNRMYTVRKDGDACPRCVG